MNKGELIEWLYEDQNNDIKAQSDRTLADVSDAVKYALENGDQVTLAGQNEMTFNVDSFSESGQEFEETPVTDQFLYWV